MAVCPGAEEVEAVDGTHNMGLGTGVRCCVRGGGAGCRAGGCRRTVAPGGHDGRRQGPRFLYAGTVFAPRFRLPQSRHAQAQDLRVCFRRRCGGLLPTAHPGNRRHADLRQLSGFSASWPRYRREGPRLAAGGRGGRPLCLPRPTDTLGHALHCRACRPQRALSVRVPG